MSDAGPLVLICGGGSGGHLTPGFALADALLAAPDPPRVVFLTGDRPVDRRMTAAEPFECRRFPLAPPGRTARSPAAAAAFARCLTTARRLAAGRPCVTVGTGGYASVPGVLGAKSAGAAVVLLEPNAVDGAATRWLGSLATHVLRGLSGTPNRKSHLPREVPVEPDSLLVLGGSSGSAALDAAVPAALAGLPEVGRLTVSHQCGGDPAAVRAAYNSAGASPNRTEVAPFFPDAPVRLARAAVTVCRAGAVTLAEAAAYGVRPVLVPYPHAGGHQLANARRHAAAQGSPVAEEGAYLADRLRGHLAAALAAPPPRARRLTPWDPAADLAALVRGELARRATDRR